MLFFYSSTITLPCYFRSHRAGSQLKKSIDIFNFKQRLLSLDMKSKVVQHFPKINLSHFNFWIFNLNFFWFPAFVCLSDIFLVHTVLLETNNNINRGYSVTVTLPSSELVLVRTSDKILENNSERNEWREAVHVFALLSLSNQHDYMSFMFL